MPKKILTVLIIVTMSICISANCFASTLTGNRKENADVLARVCIENWETYGCLPSVCIAQGIIESGLGEACISYNFWGIGGGYYQYTTLEEGVFGYMETINNGYYGSAPFTEDPSEQISKIINGGYCEDPNYYYKVMSAISMYDLTSYDQELWNYLEEKRLALHNENYNTYYANTPCNTIIVDGDIFNNAGIAVYADGELIGIYKAIPGDVEGCSIGTSDLNLVGKTVQLKVYEGAVG